MICSCVLPSRKRPRELKGLLDSIWSTVTNKDNIEVIIRLHDDDWESVTMAGSFMMHNTTVIIGPGSSQYSDHGKLFDDACRLAKGDWIFSMMDDAVLTGNGWDEQLKAMPTDVVCAPEGLKNGGSYYHRPDHAQTPIVHKSFKLFGHGVLQFPHDTWIWSLRHERGWQQRFLTGLTYNHLCMAHTNE